MLALSRKGGAYLSVLQCNVLITEPEDPGELRARILCRLVRFAGWLKPFCEKGFIVVLPVYDAACFTEGCKYVA